MAHELKMTGFAAVSEHWFKVKKRGDRTVLSSWNRFHAIEGEGFLVVYEESIEFWRKKKFAGGGRVIEISNGKPGFSITFDGKKKRYAAGEKVGITISADKRKISIC